MNLKKISLLLGILSIMFTTETFARFRVGPAKSMGDEDRKTSRQTRSAQRKQPVKLSEIKKTFRSLCSRKKQVKETSPKEQTVRSSRNRTALMSCRPNMQNRDRSQACSRDMANLRKRGPVKTSDSKVNVQERNGQWSALYELDNGVIVKRESDKIGVYNAGGSAVNRNHQYRKNTMINGKRLKDDVDLSLAQTPAEFQKEVTKLGGIKKIVPLY